MKSRLFTRTWQTLSAGMIFIFLLACSIPSIAHVDDHGRQGKILAGYFEEWSIYGANYNVANLQNNAVADHLTHLLYAFGNVAPTSGPPNALCQLADTWADYQTPYLPSVNGQAYSGPLYGNFAALQQLKQLHPNLKIMISLGGASSANAAGFAYAASTPALRSQLAASCIDLFINGNVAPGISAAGIFDGIDIDWEFPGAADKHNFTLLVEEFRRQLDVLGKANRRHYLLTMFAPAGSQNYSNLELAKIARQLDFFNLQGYDLNGTWETVTNHAASIFDSRQDPNFGEGLYDEAVVDAYLRAGVPGRQLVLGVPLYGYGWTGVPGMKGGLYQSSTGPAPSPAGDALQTPGVATYMTLSSLAGVEHHFDAKRFATWIYDPSTLTFWSYDDPVIATAKAVYIDLRVPGGLGGAMVWAVKDDDANGTMIKTLASGLGISQRH
ncbi:MAG TPA: glycoside hydrolase family 18 protein [Terriglobales bacterium]|nr:glycoside hydrolase family 18 protein [Terriglobales bacterium]